MHSEAALIEQCRRGEEQAFRRLVEIHKERVWRTVAGMLGEDGAEDVAQEVFIRCFRKLDQFKGESSFGTYLTRIAINLSLNELKRRKRRQERFLALDGMSHPPQVQDPADPAQRWEQRQWIGQALQQLPPEQRAVVVLRLVEGHSVAETAELLQLPPGTVASRLARAQLKLRELLQPLVGASPEPPE
ncbi:MAG: RNA polymerase sigma factor [Bacteroidetes bacterium]|nr:MAG: RNA polymerase sigma factor [Bacteroidota bacterium]